MRTAQRAPREQAVGSECTGYSSAAPNRIGECIVGQVVNLRRIGNPPVEACIGPSAGGLHKSLLPDTPPMRLSTQLNQTFTARRASPRASPQKDVEVCAMSTTSRTAVTNSSI